MTPSFLPRLGAGMLLLAGCAAPRQGGIFPPLPPPGPLRFQQQLAGRLPGHPTTVRWELRFRGAQITLTATRLRASDPATRVTYQGTWTRDHRGLAIRGSTEQQDTGFPQEIALSCLRTVLAVLPSGADLIEGDACKGDGPPPRWAPAQARDLAVWHCHVDDEPASPWNGFERHGPLSFAAGAGIEWLFVNNDCSGQEGAYRFPP